MPILTFILLRQDVLVKVATEMKVGEAEVVSPFRNAVYLVDNSIGEVHMQGFHVSQPVPERHYAEPFR